jgi:hypothetical protein
VTTLNNTDPAIHNFLLTLYATQKTTDETALLNFLKNEVRVEQKKKRRGLTLVLGSRNAL